MILQLHFFDLALAVILAVPALFARTSPFLFTVATFLFEDFHEMVPEQPVTFSLHVFPTESVAFFLLIFADAAVASGVCIREAANENVITPAVRARFIFLFIVMFLSFC